MQLSHTKRRIVFTSYQYFAQSKEPPTSGLTIAHAHLGFASYSRTRPVFVRRGRILHCSAESPKQSADKEVSPKCQKTISCWRPSVHM